MALKFMEYPQADGYTDAIEEKKKDSKTSKVER